MDMTVATTEERLQRFIQLVDERLSEEEKNRDKKKNKNFVQMYPKGFDRVIAILGEYPLAAKIYMFLAKHIEPGTGAVVASQQLLADELDISVRSIQRGTKWLDQNNIVLRIKLGAGTVYAYCLDPDEVWKSWNTSKKYAAFTTKTLARKEDNGDVKRRLMVMLKGKETEPET
ncbi:replication protein [Crocosphaera chwakensis CCY0110]|uniref:Replication protein n=2 Tax=Crocosphaera TaxID=263510 RepID=A3IZP5_9CHRO|nr:replication protein [Crocosphaera chwakensis CCY0110]